MRRGDAVEDAEGYDLWEPGKTLVNVEEADTEAGDDPADYCYDDYSHNDAQAAVHGDGGENLACYDQVDEGVTEQDDDAEDNY